MHGPGRKCKPDQGQGEWDGEQVRVLESSYDGTARPERRIILHPCLHFLLHGTVGEDWKDVFEVHPKYQV